MKLISNKPIADVSDGILHVCAELCLSLPPSAPTERQRRLLFVVLSSLPIRAAVQNKTVINRQQGSDAVKHYLWLSFFSYFGLPVDFTLTHLQKPCGA